MSNLSELLPSGAGQNQVEFVASGTLPNGKPVILKADGTVEAVTGIATEAGTSAVFETSETIYISGTYDSANEKVVIAYQTQLSGNYGRVVVGTVSGNSISFGSVVTFSNRDTTHISTTYDPDSGKVVIAYGDTSSNGGRAIIGTVSGTSISFGTPVVFVTSAQARYISLTYDTNSNKVVVFYRVGTDGGKGKARVGTVSGTSISFGTEVVFNNGYTEECSSTFDSANNKVLVAFLDGSNSDYGTVIVGTVSGTNISFGSEVVFNSNTTNQISAVFDTANNKVVIAWFAQNNSYYGTAIVGTVSGTSISFGSQVVFNAASTHHVSAAFDSTNGKVIIGYRDVGNSSYGTAIAGTVSGTSISFGTEFVFNNGYASWNDAIYDSTNSKVVFGFRDEINSNKGTGVVFRLGSTNLTSTNLVGISAADAADAATAKINTWGGINSTVTPAAGALTTYAVTVGNYGGNKYYIDGVLTPTLNLIKGNTYKFDQSNSTNSGHPFVFSIAGGSSYSTGVTIVGTPGNAGAYTQIVVAADAPILYYKCSVHSGMGGQANTTAASLTIASDYYVQTDGTITTASTSPAQKIGTAISSTTINIKDLT